MPRHHSLRLSKAAAVAVFAAAQFPASAIDAVDFNRDIRPILSEKCFACHGPDDEARKAKLRLDVRDDSLKDRDGFRAIVPGKPDDSDLIVRIQSNDPDEVMPPPKEHHEISPAEIATLTRWIQEGAPYAPHWSFQKPFCPSVPARSDGASPIDSFIQEKLVTNGLSQSPEAQRFELIRRVSFDLVGLPPTPAEVDAFVKDPAPDAYERLVDRLLASPHYGERWAKMWLDLARYADSTGYGSDKFRLNAWPWRDWVIDAFNRNVPYDQFTIEQLAGDLLPDPTPEQISATAFHRNTMTNVEGGTDDEEYRVAAVKDRVATTMQVWMGLTAQCAQCHSHKFDPISQREYYGLFAIFNQSEDADREDESPRLPLPTPAQKAARTRLETEIAHLEKERESITPEFETELHQWEADMARPVNWTPLKSTPRDPGASEFIVPGPQPAFTAFRLESNATSAKATDFSARIVPRGNAAPVGRFVRITRKSESAWLELAEVEILSGDNAQNIAREGKPSASSTDFGGTSDRANDGETNGHFFEAKSVFHSAEQANPWWEVDLREPKPVSQIVVWPRTDAHVGMLKNLHVELLDVDRNVVWETDVADPIIERRSLPITAERAIAFADPTGNAHFAVFPVAGKLDIPENADLIFSIRPTPSSFQVLGTTQDGPILALPDEIRAILAIEPSEREPKQRQQIADFFRPLAQTTKTINARIESLHRELAAIKPVELPIMHELPENARRSTHILHKGNHLSPGEEVGPVVPTTFLPAPAGNLNRLALARWLVSRDNPLTARVTVNRFWSRLFGTGLVESEEDFGTQGQLPSHPELLDWLAVEFMDGGWDVKKLLKHIVMTRTYRQSSRTDPIHLEKDPRNRLLARFPRQRFDAEAVRDQALLLSGLLTDTIGGPSVYPPQPDGLWQVAFNGGQNGYPTSTGPDRYRRGIYTFWRRTRPNPTQTTFDAPSRETCTLRRIPTNTPLQAFVTLNDPVFVECAQALARRILQEGGPDDETRIQYALTLCLGHSPTSTQLQAIRDLLQKALTTYSQDLDSAQKLATNSVNPLPETMDISQAAAWTVVANVLLNLDSVLTKG